MRLKTTLAHTHAHTKAHAANIPTITVKLVHIKASFRTNTTVMTTKANQTHQLQFNNTAEQFQCNSAHYISQVKKQLCSHISKTYLCDKYVKHII